MRGAAKKHRTDEVEVMIGGNSRPRLFLVPKEKAQGLVQVLKEFEVSADNAVDANEVFPELDDKKQRPAAVLRGARQKESLSQIELAGRLGVTQGDLSKMENGKRPIGRKMAMRLGKLLKIDYRVFL
ncbi:MAG TPA: helix-turn-helix transcriptional regulator [Bdellovibrionota bacterium]|nr:helix-turn-helix transcriptional regulator [Bdellovibrionota bacterium]